MEALSDSDRIAVLREEIRRIGRACRIAKWCLMVVLPGLLVGWIIRESLGTDPYLLLYWLVFTSGLAAAVPLSASGLLVLLAAFPLAWLVRRLQAIRLAQRFRALPREWWI